MRGPGLEDRVGLPLLPELDQQLEDVLAALGNVRTSKSWTVELLGRDAELRRRLAHLARERVRREALGERLRRDRERDVAHVTPRSTSRAIVPPQPNSPSSVCGARTSTRFRPRSSRAILMTVRLGAHGTAERARLDRVDPPCSTRGRSRGTRRRSGARSSRRRSAPRSQGLCSLALRGGADWAHSGDGASTQTTSQAARAGASASSSLAALAAPPSSAGPSLVPPLVARCRAVPAAARRRPRPPLLHQRRRRRRARAAASALPRARGGGAALVWRRVRGSGVRRCRARSPGRPPRSSAFACPVASLVARPRAARNRSRSSCSRSPLLVAVVARAPFPPGCRACSDRSRSPSPRCSQPSGSSRQATHRLLFHSLRRSRSANAYRPFFRVTSLFRDPSLYGRHVVLGIAILLVALCSRDIIPSPLPRARRGHWLVGLFFSYSQSSFAALFAGHRLRLARGRRPALCARHRGGRGRGRAVAGGALVVLTFFAHAPRRSA